MFRILTVIILIATFSFVHAVDVIPLEKDGKAPHAGLLVKEARFVKMLEAEMEVIDLKGRVKIQKTLTTTLETMYIEKLEKSSAPLRWYEKPSFNRWLGFTLGVVVTGAAIWGGTEIVKAVR